MVWTTNPLASSAVTACASLPMFESCRAFICASFCSQTTLALAEPPLLFSRAKSATTCQPRARFALTVVCNVTSENDDEAL